MDSEFSLVDLLTQDAACDKNQEGAFQREKKVACDLLDALCPELAMLMDAAMPSDGESACVQLPAEVYEFFREYDPEKDAVPTEPIGAAGSRFADGHVYDEPRGGDRTPSGCGSVPEDGGLQWLHRTFPSFSTHANSDVCKKTPREPKPMSADFLPPGLCEPSRKKSMRFGHDYGGCERGLCCVYSMWFDPEYVHSRKCTHRCNLSLGRFAHCGPSLFEDSTLGREYRQYTRRDQINHHDRGRSQAAGILSKRRTPTRTRGVCRARSLAPRSYTLSFSPTRPRPCIPLVASRCKVTVVKRQRRTGNPTPAEKIRRRMASRDFGKRHFQA